MIKKLMKKATTLAMTFVVLTSVFAFSLPAFAAVDVWNAPGDTGDGQQAFADNTGFGTTDLRTTIAKTIQLIISFLGIIAVVIILIGGFKWMTAGGSEDKIAEAKKLLVAGIIGLVIILFAYAIATFVLSSLASVTNNGI